MKIGIDACILKQKEYKGIAHTTWSILRIWKDKYPEHEYYLIADGKIHIPETLPENWHIICDRAHSPLLYTTHAGIEGVIKSEGIDVLWGPNFLLPQRNRACRYVVTVHDLGLFRIRGTASMGTYAILRLLGKKSCEIADRVIAISNATANDVCEIYRIPREKISVCYNGVHMPPAYQTGENNREKPYFLFLSTIEPRKNPETVLEAFEYFCETNGNYAELVFAGGWGWKTSRFRRKLQRSKYRQQVVLMDYVTEEEKWELLRNATALLYPSLYEGFGLPILEAMSVGTPVITSNVSSMPEVGGDAAFYVQCPKDAGELANVMRVLSGISVSQREKMSPKMKRQVLKFSWDKCADQVMEVLTEVKG